MRLSMIKVIFPSLTTENWETLCLSLAIIWFQLCVHTTGWSYDFVNLFRHPEHVESAKAGHIWSTVQVPPKARPRSALLPRSLPNAAFNSACTCELASMLLLHHSVSYLVLLMQHCWMSKNGSQDRKAGHQRNRCTTSRPKYVNEQAANQMLTLLRQSDSADWWHQHPRGRNCLHIEPVRNTEFAGICCSFQTSLPNKCKLHMCSTFSQVMER